MLWSVAPPMLGNGEHTFSRLADGEKALRSIPQV